MLKAVPAARKRSTTTASQCSLPHLQSTASNRGSTVGARGFDISDTFLGASGNPSSRHELESVESLAAFQKASSIEMARKGWSNATRGHSRAALAAQWRKGRRVEGGGCKRNSKPASHTVDHASDTKRCKTIPLCQSSRGRAARSPRCGMPAASHTVATGVGVKSARI